jgi:cation:H+ antiporter
VVGSNIFNILLVLGVSASVSPETIQYDIASNFDLYFLLFSTVLLFLFLFVGTKATEKEGTKFYLIDKWQAAILLTIVIGYTVFVLVG